MLGSNCLVIFHVNIKEIKDKTNAEYLDTRTQQKDLWSWNAILAYAASLKAINFKALIKSTKISVQTAK